MYFWLYRIALSVTILFEYPKLPIFKLQKSCYLQRSCGNSSIWSSQLYDGSISDKEIVNRSEFLKKELWSDGDSVMADRGFTIHNELARVGVSLNIPAFLGGRDYLTKAEVKASQIIASVRIHVEKAIQRIETYSIIRNEIPLTLHGSINQIWTVISLLTNLVPPLIDESNKKEN